MGLEKIIYLLKNSCPALRKIKLVRHLRCLVICFCDLLLRILWNRVICISTQHWSVRKTHVKGEILAKALNSGTLLLNCAFYKAVNVSIYTSQC